MSQYNFDRIIYSFNILTPIKWTIVFALVLYTIFALVTVRQTITLGATLKTDISPLFKLFSLLNLAASIFLLFVSIFFL